MKTTPLFLLFVALAGFDLAAVLLALGKVGASTSLPSVPTAAAIHFLVAAMVSLVVVFFPGTNERSGHRTIAILAGGLSLLTPVFGALAAFVIIAGLYRQPPTGDGRDLFVVGNPLQVQNLAPEPSPLPISEPLAVSLSYGQLHGQRLAPSLLRNVGTNAAVTLLRRLCEQPDARTQLYAQAALSSLLEETEAHVIRQRARVNGDPNNSWEAVGLARAITRSADLGRHSQSETSNRIREAISLFDYAIDLKADEAQLYLEKARCLIRLGDNVSLDQVPDLYGHLLASPNGQGLSHQLDCEYFAAIGNWPRTANSVARINEGHHPAVISSACRRFWTCPVSPA